MFNNEADFKKLINRLNIDDKPNPAHQENLRRQMLSAFNETAKQPMLQATGFQIIRRIIMKSKITKLAAAAVIIAAILIGIHQFGGSVDVASVAFANVAHQLRNARTLTYTIVTQVEDRTMRMEVAFKEPGHMRYSGERGIVSILDQTQNVCLVINPLKKEFIEIELSNLPPEQSQVNLIEELRALPERADEVLGQRQMDGRMVQGFRVSENGVDRIVWIDTETSDLVRVEAELVNVPGAYAVATDFKFDVDLDDSLFSLTPPEGYTRQSIQFDMSEVTEQDLIKLLRFWATEAKDSLFPPSLNPIELAKAQRQMQKNGEFSQSREPEQQVVQRSWEIMRGLKFVLQMQPENDWHYAGKDVKLGDADKAIFWYRPKGSETYRVIYGDLTVKDVASENLPRQK